MVFHGSSTGANQAQPCSPLAHLAWPGHGLFQNSCLVTCVENTSSLPGDWLGAHTQLNSTCSSFFPLNQ